MKKLLAILAFTTFSNTAMADGSFKYIVFISGEISQATQNGKPIPNSQGDITATSSLYENGRSGFAFYIQDKAFSFSGNKDSEPEKFLYILEVNSAMTIENGSEPISKEAKGKCTLKGDLQKNANITCDVTSDAKYLISFNTDKITEVVYGFGHEPFDPEIAISHGVNDFDRIYVEDGIDGTEQHSISCYQRAQPLKYLPTLLRCAGADYAAMLIDESYAKGDSKLIKPYFKRETTIKRVEGEILKYSNGKKEKGTDDLLALLEPMSNHFLNEVVMRHAKSHQDE